MICYFYLKGNLHPTTHPVLSRGTGWTPFGSCVRLHTQNNHYTCTPLFQAWLLPSHFSSPILLEGSVSGVSKQNQKQLCQHTKSVEQHFHYEGKERFQMASNNDNRKPKKGRHVSREKAISKEGRMKKMLNWGQKKDWSVFLISACC